MSLDTILEDLFDRLIQVYNLIGELWRHCGVSKKYILVLAAQGLVEMPTKIIVEEL
jgi:hypothetical protein